LTTVFVEGAHRSAQQNGKPYTLQRDDDLKVYRQSCIDHGLLDE
jgi:hypothetical protein